MNRGMSIIGGNTVVHDERYAKSLDRKSLSAITHVFRILRVCFFT